MNIDNNNKLIADLFSQGLVEEQTTDLVDYLKELWSHKWLIIVIAATGYLIAALYASTLTPIYRTSVVLNVEKKSQGVIGVESVSRSLGRNYRNSTQLILIKSYPVLVAAIDELNRRYTVTPRYFRYIGAAIARHHKEDGLAEPLLGLGAYAWGGEVLDLDHFDVSGKLETVSSEWKLIVGENREYRLLSSNGEQVLSGKVGEKASAEYLGSTIEIFVSKLLARPGVWFTIRNQSRESSIASLGGQLSVSLEGESVFDDTGILKLSIEGPDPYKITDEVNAVADAYVKHDLMMQSKEAQQKLDFIDGQLPALKANLNMVQRSLQEYRKRIETLDLEYETTRLLDQFSESGKEISELQLKKEEMLRRFTETHPEVKVISRQIEHIREKREELEKKLLVVPEREWEFIQKTRDVDLATQLYVVLLGKAQELKIAKAGIIGNAQIINPASVMSSPVRPDRSKIRTRGLLFGLLLGVALVILRRLMQNKVVDSETLEKETGLHVYANIPHSPVEFDISSVVIQGRRHKHAEARLLAIENDTDLAVEALRSFRTSVRFVMKTSENNVIIISGPSPSVGKSFFASNFAVVAAKANYKVVVVDADMRKGNLHRHMGKARKPGLSELIANDVSVDEAVHEITDNLYFISSGERPPNPSELLSFDGFHKLLEHLQGLYDLVIIDTPPILAVTDASIIAHHGGHLFLVLRYGQHPIKEVKAAISAFQQNGVNITGLLLNDVNINRRGYGYGYGYEYKEKQSL